MQQYLESLLEKIRSLRSRSGMTPRKVIPKIIFWNIKYLLKYTPRSKFKDNTIHIAFIPQAGIGDFTFAAKYIYCLKKNFGENITIDIFADHHFEAAECFWQGKKHINHLFFSNTPKQNVYDCEIALLRFPAIRYIDKKRVSQVGTEHFKQYLELLSRFQIQNPLLYHSDYLGRCYSLLHGRTRENQADLENILNMSQVTDFYIPLPENDEETLGKFGIKENAYIIIQTGSGKHFRNENDIRQWPVKYYEELIEKIRKINPSIPIIQIGEAYHKTVKNTDINLLGKTSFREMLAILKGARLLISQEGGLPILRHFISRKPSCVIFGPTDRNFFGFSENSNLSASNCDGGCEWILDNWYQTCIKTGKNIGCMKYILTEKVIESIKKQLI
ncbi:hypothetical protein NB636_02705 [Oxalobacter aliiformigenes]|uniref:glycosyltransferase family 9 protein n=1 Tax=Oxalobacter aliiformigenes TaxID=2946593 RepID=UPI0022AF6BA6|nr:glycosyltransferase family 9 protein [Oxalobacter aliiformigenes]MCZ4064442.1 hypothetical protein [Oxalobacter aliiformigenes]WAV99786.1 hypothetical protein NB636_02705 [Oxalobacter aliiformigenes]